MDLKKLAGICMGMAWGIVVLMFMMGRLRVADISMEGLLAALTTAVVLSLVSTMVLINEGASQWIKQTTEGLAQEFEDDINDLNQGKFGRSHIMLLITAIAGVCLVGLASAYGKWDEEWFGVSIFWYIVPFDILIILIACTRDWFIDTSYVRTAWWAFAIPITGVILAIFFGLYFTEPIETGGDITAYNLDFPSGDETTTVVSVNQPAPGTYDYGRTRIYPTYVYVTSWGSGSSSSGYSSSGSPSFRAPSCSGKSCEGLGLVVLIIVLIVLTIILVVGSIFIPHFWILAGITFLTIMAIMTLREWRVVPSRMRRSSWASW